MLKPPRTIDPLQDPAPFRAALVKWFHRHGRDYPWRRTRDPYAILVSEVMLQQTRIGTVLGKGYYDRFLDRFPGTAALAAADDATLLKAWEGLGYYRRARMLRETARAVIHQHGGIFPQDLAKLMALPGIGRYTAGALRAFAFEQTAVIVDGNIARVLARITDFCEPVDGSAATSTLWERAGCLADNKYPRAYHSALMELGQTACRPGVPDCGACPVARFCAARDPHELPRKFPKAAPTALTEHALWLRDRRGRLLLHQETGARRTGLWKLPLRDEAETSKLPSLAEHPYSITRYRVRLIVYNAANAHPTLRRPQPGDSWIKTEEIPKLAMAAPFRRAVESLLAQDF